MMMYSTREAANVLQVSPTTIKRWASHFQNRFSKDDLGHYVFGKNDVETLSFIKKQLEMKLSLNQIVLDDVVDPQLNAKNGTASNGPHSEDDGRSVTQIAEQYGKMERRLNFVEYKLSEKADDIVCVQLLEHRREIDELTRSLKLLTEHMEEVACSLAKLHQQSEPPAFHQPVKRRKLLASLFQL